MLGMEYFYYILIIFFCIIFDTVGIFDTFLLTTMSILDKKIVLSISIDQQVLIMLMR